MMPEEACSYVYRGTSHVLCCVHPSPQHNSLFGFLSGAEFEQMSEQELKNHAKEAWCHLQRKLE